jgi:uncharacterized protein (DUF1684 family)
MPDIGYLIRQGDVTVLMAAGIQFAVRGDVESIHEMLQDSSDDDYLLFELAEVDAKMSLRRSTIVMAQRAQVTAQQREPDLVVPAGMPQGLR